MFKIMVVEDDAELRNLFKKVLEKNGYEVIIAVDGKDALDKKEIEYTDLIVTDVMMPNMNGFDFIKALRESFCETPVLMITAKDSFDDMRKGFSVGADDYLKKPVVLNEMLLRISALLRRAKMISERKQTVGGYELLSESFTVKTKEGETVLPKKEFMILYKLASYPNKIFTKQQIMDEIWGYETETDAHSVEVHVGRLRERFRNNRDFDIVTIRGVGYKLVKNCD